jgi:tRNA(adenine34) deaminase
MPRSDRPIDKNQYEHFGGEVQSRSGGSWTASDEQAMRRALELAAQAADAAEVPVGAVLIKEETVIAEGWNHPIASNDPTSHAEIEALREAARRLGNYRVPGSTLYVTLEPCVMCAGAMVLARIDRLVFAARDIRFGAVRSKFRLADSDLLNHRVRVEEGLLAAEAAELLGRFFQERRGNSTTE